MSQPSRLSRPVDMTNTEQTSVLITGGNKGLGFEAARRLGDEGWKVFLGSRDEGRGRAAAARLADAGVDVVMVPLDVTVDESVSDAVRLVRRHTDRLDVLINNAGTSGNVVPPAEATADEIHSVYNTNVYGPIRVTHAFLPLLRVGGLAEGGHGVQCRRFLRGSDRSRAAGLEDARAGLQLLEGGAEHGHRCATPKRSRTSSSTSQRPARSPTASSPLPT